MAEDLHFDAFIVGSDQVWRPCYSPGITTFFLDFLNGRTNVKRIAYAASFGVDKWEYKPALTRQCKKLAQKFDAISVREDSAVLLCNNYLNVQAKHLIDPTLLLNKDDYINLLGKNDIQNMKNKMMVYVLDQTPEKKSIIKKINQHFNLEINSVMPIKSFSRENRKDITQCTFPPVTEWLLGFYNAEFVVTDSFHGTVFSIIFNKPFITIGNKDRGLSRFTSLLKLFELEDRLISNSEDINSKLLDKQINFASINKQIESEKKKSFDFLKILN